VQLLINLARVVGRPLTADMLFVSGEPLTYIPGRNLAINVRSRTKRSRNSDSTTV